MNYIKTKHNKYPYKLTSNVSIYVGDFPEMEHEYFCIDDRKILTLFQDYAIDGVTGWIDFAGLMPGAFPHDALLQAIDLELLEESYRKKTHEIFWHQCYKTSWEEKLSARVAYTGLKLLHPLWHKVTG